MIRWIKYWPTLWVSSLVGFFVYCRTPSFFAKILKHILIRSLRIDPSEAEKEVEEYACFGDFFTRKLKEGARPLAAYPWVYPCDGIIGQFGNIEEGRLYQVKGKEYQLKDLVVHDDIVNRYQKGTYLTIYLSPRHYHRVHMPCDATPDRFSYQSGRLLPVNLAACETFSRLFCRNERWICEFKTEFGYVAILLVGALNVGGIELDRHPWKGHGRKAPPQGLIAQQGERAYQKGDPLGLFAMGSTVVILGDASVRENWSKINFSLDQECRMGQSF